MIHNNYAFSAGTTRYGGGIYLHNIASKAVITANLIYSNVANFSGKGYGGCIWLDKGTGNEIINNLILTNTSSITNGLGYGGGINLASTDNSTILGNEIKGNIAQAGTTSIVGSCGGAIYIRDCDNTIIASNLLQNNTASLLSSGSGGAIYIWGSDDSLISENVVRYNIASAATGMGGSGGAIYIYYSLNSIVNANQIMSNTAAVNSGSGGGILFSHNTSFNMANNVLAYNNAMSDGGGVELLADASGLITGTLANNTFIGNGSGSGRGDDAIDIQTSYVLVTITNNIIYSHTYGIYVESNSTANLFNNLFYDNSYNVSGSGTYTNLNPVVGQDPLLNDSYHLLFGSPAIGAGISVYWVSHDIDGDPRPQGMAYDIGADEFLYKKVFLPFIVRSSP